MSVIAKQSKQYPTVQLRTPTGFVYDKRKDGWELVENVELVGEPILGLAEFLQPGEDSVNGEVMVERAKALGNCAGQLHAERLLAQQQDIPKEYRQFYLVFPGTSWRHPLGDRDVPYLRWFGRRWGLNFHWLGSDWHSHVRLVRLCE